MVGPIAVNCYVIACETTRKAAVVDPGDDEGKILTVIKNNNYNLTHILLTHGHVDHIAAVVEVKKATQAEINMCKDDLILVENSGIQADIFGLRPAGYFTIDKYLRDEDKINVGNLEIKVIFTPGHSPGGVCYLTENCLFTGDTLFSESIGRTDLPGGSYESLLSSIRNKLLILPSETIVYPGHGQATTIERELQFNPFLSH
ncbi:MBL fold metallo-hydrolase [candidate division KSB1 bacterium]|nr:MBL fold metallo-hydrolase [candidate division KSB1 bacterium]